MDYTINIDYSSANSRQDFLSIYYLYFYVCQRNRFNFDLGNYIITLLSYIVENGSIDFHAIQSTDIKKFTDSYFKGLNMHNPLSNEDLNSILNRLEGVNPDGTPIVYSFANRDKKLSYISYDIEGNGYKVTDMGLQFLISSNEVPQDTKLTVSLYLFRLQIEKHKYKSALDTIKNINMETKRQIALKDKVLDIAHYDPVLGNSMYHEYWKDFISLRSEEQQHYQQAKDFLKKYQDLTENLTISDKEVLRKIDVELNVSTTLQNRYILEVSSMGKELSKLSLSNISTIFENKFNFKRHFDEAYYTDNPFDTLLKLLTPIMLPKKIHYFDISVPFMKQPVKSKDMEKSNVKIDAVTQYIDYSKLYEDRKINNYYTFFVILIDTLSTHSIDDIREYINIVRDIKGDTAIASIDFLSFLTDLSMFSEVNTSTQSNVQTIRLNVTSNDVYSNTFERTLSDFWCNRLHKEYSAKIYVSTNVKDIVTLDDDGGRSIGNISLTLKGDI